MKKDEAERAIRHLCHEWAQECGIVEPPTDQPSFSDFRSWLSEKGYSHYLTFRATMGPLHIAEMWFDQEFKQTWRN
ncbi:hypothetical protein MVG78_01485 [Roseomonas gilardii subsp. gilardii]|uniref:hypothetical protein n=1 Tax=Roseomonas gilardii TaxID=257708 RepID=UPI001FF9FDB5|nr:hypothetical protein [Roseomonas gilardii]UPG72898.1 hypothetical protein MVG78_01485 [Roseomonas gilardii subsp. gilardii]